MRQSKRLFVLIPLMLITAVASGFIALVLKALVGAGLMTFSLLGLAVWLLGLFVKVAWDIAPK